MTGVWIGVGIATLQALWEERRRVGAALFGLIRDVFAAFGFVIFIAIIIIDLSLQ